MAHYLVRARPRLLDTLRQRLDSGEIRKLRPFGGEMHAALLKARLTPDGWATWEEQCFCNPPLKQERAILDLYFTDLETLSVNPGAGWGQIESLPGLWE